MYQGEVTVFGASGFVGRYVVKKLAQKGFRVRCAVRDPEDALLLKPMGEVSQVNPIQCNIRSEDSVRSAVRGADAVINLVGILYESGKQSFEAIHLQAAERIAKVAKEEGVTRFVHMSALGADKNSFSKYAKTKGKAEETVRAIYPNAVIIRPSVIFGPEDNFFNKFALMARIAPALPLIGCGKTLFQPVYVGDVAEAIARTLVRDEAQGKTFELGGPERLSLKEVLEICVAYSGRKRRLLPVPFFAARILGSFMGLLPVPPLTADQVTLLERDNVASPGMPGLDDLGIQPTNVHSVLPKYMPRHGKGGIPLPSKIV